MRHKKSTLKRIPYKLYQQAANIILPNDDYASYMLETSVIKIHPHKFHLLISLSKCALSLLFYLVEVMDTDDHQIINHPATRSDFIKHASRHLSTKYEDLTVRRAFAELLKAGYLIKRDNDRRLVINPLLIFKGDDENREKLISSLIKEAVDPRFKNEDIIIKLGIKKY